MKRKAKRWWRAWVLTFYHRWVLVRYYSGGVILFTSKRAATQHVKEGGFGERRFLVLPPGQRPRRKP
jgi:hypothetical protein